MQQYWDARARDNALWYVDTTVDYDHPDIDAFLEAGERIASHALTHAPRSPAGTDVALEIGCGVGRICRALAAHFDQVIGVDISPEMIARASELVPEAEVEFRVSDGTNLRGIPDGSVDFVMSFTVLQHLPDPDLVTGYLREAARVLRPGGVIAIQWNNLPAVPYHAQTLWLRMQERLGRGQGFRHRTAPEFRGTPVPLRTITRTLEASGCPIIGIEGAGSLFAWAWATRSSA